MQPLHRSLAASLVVAAAALPHAHAALPSQYHVQDLGAKIQAESLSANGVVAGQTVHNRGYQPRLWVNAQPVKLVDPKSDGDALGVNDAGIAVGWVNNKNGQRLTALKWTSADTWVDVGAGLPSTDNQAVAIDDAGDCILQGYIGESRHSYVSAGCVAGNAVDLGSLGGGETYAFAINANGQIAGWSRIANKKQHPHAFLYTGGAMQDLGLLPHDQYAAARGLNDHGDVVGYCVDRSRIEAAFFYSNGVMQGLGTLGGLRSDAFAVNNADIVVGSTQTKNGFSHAFVRDMGTAGNPMLDLQKMLDDSGAGWELTEAVGIDDAGQILVHAKVGKDAVPHSALLIPLQ